MVVVGVDADGHVGAPGEGRLPSFEVVLDGHLVVASTLEEEDGAVERRGDGDRAMGAKVQPVGGGGAER